MSGLSGRDELLAEAHTPLWAPVVPLLLIAGLSGAVWAWHHRAHLTVAFGLWVDRVLRNQHIRAVRRDRR